MKFVFSNDGLLMSRIIAETVEDEKAVNSLEEEAHKNGVIALPTARHTIGKGPVEVLLAVNNDPALAHCWE